MAFICMSSHYSVEVSSVAWEPGCNWWQVPWILCTYPAALDRKRFRLYPRDTRTGNRKLSHTEANCPRKISSPEVSHANNSGDTWLLKYKSSHITVWKAESIPFWECIFLVQERVLFVTKFLILVWEKKIFLGNCEASYKSPRFPRPHSFQLLCPKIV